MTGRKKERFSFRSDTSPHLRDGKILDCHKKKENSSTRTDPSPSMRYVSTLSIFVSISFLAEEGTYKPALIRRVHLYVCTDLHSEKTKTEETPAYHCRRFEPSTDEKDISQIRTHRYLSTSPHSYTPVHTPGDMEITFHLHPSATA